MMRRTQAGTVVLLLLLWPALASAQQASGIAGVVTDASGGVLPGVTVEASSPALIEKVRTVITDGEGRYNVVDLRPGSYTVTFTLPGFTTVRREGIALTAGFTATVNAEMRVGALEETITVTGASPLVDTQNTRQQVVVSREVLTALPSSTVTLSNIGIITPGMAGQVNVGGSAGAYSMSSVLNVTFHGKSGGTTAYDGMRITDMDCASCTGPIVSPATIDQWTVETGGGLAESDAAGVRVNHIPKSGGNSVSASISGAFANSSLQSDNLTDDLRARGLTSVNGLRYLRSVDGFVGGPIKQDKLWYFIAGRYTASQNQLAGIYFNKTQGSPFYTPDLSRPGYRDDELEAGSLRLTWQATQKDKFNFHIEPQHNYVHRGEFAAPEAMYWYNFWPMGIFQATWNSVRTNKLLLEVSGGAAITHWPGPPNPGVGPHDIPVLEQTTNFLYNSNTNLGGPKDSDRYTQRASLSYVTGSHAFKGGMVLMEGIHNLGTQINDNIQYVMLNQVPNQMIILDTNVLSALMRTVPDPPVVAWLDRQPAESVWITSITVFEARLGLGVMPQGRRKRALETAFARLLEDDLDNRVLDFDVAAATSAAALPADRQRAGRPADLRDTQIAGIALARRATLATRNVRHFADLKVPVVDPWTAS